MKDLDVKFLNVKISTFYFTDILGKEVSETLIDEYDKIIRKAKKMRVPKEESVAYFLMVEKSYVFVRMILSTLDFASFDCFCFFRLKEAKKQPGTFVIYVFI